MGISKASPFLSSPWFLLHNSPPAVFSVYIVVYHALITIDLRDRESTVQMFVKKLMIFLRVIQIINERAKEMILSKSSLVCRYFY